MDSRFLHWLESYLRSGGQEQTPAFRGMKQPGNIDLNSRPVVNNADGTYSTVRSRSFGFGGSAPYYLGGDKPLETLLPTVAADGSGILDDEGTVAQYRSHGQHLGTFDTPGDADDYAELLHQYQAQQYAKKGGR